VKRYVLQFRRVFPFLVSIISEYLKCLSIFVRCPKGLFLKDLTLIEDGKSTCTSEGLVNFNKCTMLASTVREIQRFQASYFLQPVPELQKFLATQLQSAVELQEMCDRSCELETRGCEW
jgi:hypothetical protein